MSIDTIGDFLTVMRNGILASKSFIVAPHSTLKRDIAQILKDEGFIKDVAVIEQENNKKFLKVLLKYVDGESAIHEITRISTPGCRVHTKITQLKPVIGGLGVSILSTNKGVLAHKKARELGVGGEVICTVW